MLDCLPENMPANNNKIVLITGDGCIEDLSNRLVKQESGGGAIVLATGEP